MSKRLTETPWFTQQRRNHRLAVANATHLTRFGVPESEVVRRSGPGTRRKNPRLFDGKRQAAAQLLGLIT